MTRPASRPAERCEPRVIQDRAPSLTFLSHASKSVLTVRLWAIVWIILAITGGIKRHLITVAEYGNLVDQKI